jgi:ABC-type phosphate/phosphonate transport system substrate-binding protein
MIASLGMYDFSPRLQAANDRLWSGVRANLAAAGLAAPERLTRGAGAYWPAWDSPHLVLSQTCGFPYRARLHGRVTLVGTPDYRVEGCPPGQYRSIFVARRDDPRTKLAAFNGAALAYNEALSQSGWAAPMTHAARAGITLRPGCETGGHRASVAAVATGRADLAAIDAVTWALLLDDGAADALELAPIAMTDPTPGLPLIAAPGADAGRLASAVADAIAALMAEDARTLRLHGLVQIPASAYLAVPTPAPPSALAGAS